MNGEFRCLPMWWGWGWMKKARRLCNAIAQAGGTTQAYLAMDMDELVEALQEILSGMVEGTYTRSDPVVDYYWDETDQEYKSVRLYGIVSDPGMERPFLTAIVSSRTGYR